MGEVGHAFKWEFDWIITKLKFPLPTWHISIPMARRVTGYIKGHINQGPDVIPQTCTPNLGACIGRKNQSLV